MNRITLLLLLIGSAVLIIGLNRFETTEPDSSVPWTVEHGAEGKIELFGITLGSSTMDYALRHFQKKSDSYILIDANQSLRLVSVFKNLVINRLMADIELEYDIPQQQLEKLITAEKSPPALHIKYLSEQQIAAFKNAVIKRLTYTPSIDYDEDMVLQRFGYPDSKTNIKEGLQRWDYQAMHLQIYLNQSAADKLVYTAGQPLSSP